MLPLLYHPQGQNEASYDLDTIFFLRRQKFKKIEFYSGGLDLQYKTPEMAFPSCEIQKDNFKVSQGKQTRTKNKESLKLKILNKSNIALQL